MNKTQEKIFKLCKQIKDKCTQITQEKFEITNQLFTPEYQLKNMEEMNAFFEKIEKNIDQFPEIVCNDLRDRIPILQLSSNENLIKKYGITVNERKSRQLRNLIRELEKELKDEALEEKSSSKVVKNFLTFTYLTEEDHEFLNSITQLETAFNKTIESKKEGKQKESPEGYAYAILMIAPIIINFLLKDLQVSQTSHIKLPFVDHLKERERIMNILRYLLINTISSIFSKDTVQKSPDDFIALIKKSGKSTLNKTKEKNLKEDLEQLSHIFISPINESFILQILHTLKYYGTVQELELHEAGTQEIASSLVNLTERFPVLTFQFQGFLKITKKVDTLVREIKNELKHL